MLAQASQLFYRADYLGAFAAMESAVEELVARGDHERAAVALVRLLRAVPLAGGLYERTIDVARALIPRIGPTAELLPAARVMLALLLGESCRYAEAEDELEAALEAGSGDPLTALHVGVTRAFAIDHPHGRRAQALAGLDEAIPELERAHEADVLNYLVYARAFRAIVLSDVGRFADALEEAERVRDAAARRGLARLAAPVVAMLRFGPLAGLGHLDLLGEEIARSSPAFKRLGGALRGYRHDVAAAGMAAADGDPAGVARAVAAAREGLARHGMPYDAAMAHADLALAAAAAGLEAEARELSGEARELAERASAPWAAARAAMTAAVAWGPGEEGDAALAEALRRSSDHRLAALWSRRERRLAGELLPRALARGLEPRDTVLRLARACGAEVLAACVEGAPDAPVEARLALAEVAASAVAAEVAIDGLLKDPEPAVRKAARRAREARRKRAHESVRLITLGGFAVERDGRRIPDSAFGRQKARTLLALMACARGPVHREEVIETLWPELSKGRGLAALNSTLYALRRALEPHLSTGASSALIVAAGATYRLVLGERDSWDAAEFLRLGSEALMAEGEGSLRKLQEAEGRYAGALLPEWAFAPWTEPLAHPARGAAPDPAGAGGRGQRGGRPAGRGDQPLPPAAGHGARARGLAPGPDAHLRRRRRARAGPAPVRRVPHAPAREPRHRAEPRDPRAAHPPAARGLGAAPTGGKGARAMASRRRASSATSASCSGGVSAWSRMRSSAAAISRRSHSRRRTPSGVSATRRRRPSAPWRSRDASPARSRLARTSVRCPERSPRVPAISRGSTGRPAPSSTPITPYWVSVTPPSRRTRRSTSAVSSAPAASTVELAAPSTSPRVSGGCWAAVRRAADHRADREPARALAARRGDPRRPRSGRRIARRPVLRGPALRGAGRRHRAVLAAYSWRRVPGRGRGQWPSAERSPPIPHG